VEKFGNLLSYYRGKSVDPQRGKPLTQERLAELLEQVSGMQYTAATISNWERGASQISANDRDILVGVVQVFYECRSLYSLDEANRLLAAGHYRHLNETEMGQVFGGSEPEGPARNGREPATMGEDAAAVTPAQVLTASLKQLLAHPAASLHAALQANQNPTVYPTWSNVVETVLTRVFRGWTAATVLWSVAWITLWLATWAATFPLLRWSGENQHQLRLAAMSYTLGALLLPLFIGLLLYQQRDRAFWQEQAVGRFALPFFTCLGAIAGFHLAYGLLFAGRLAGYHLDVAAVPLHLELLAAVAPVLLAFTAAQQLPFHCLRAFGAVQFTTGDQAIFALLFLFAPLWAGALVLVYELLFLPHVTVPLVLATISLMALLAHGKRRAGRSFLPFVYPLLFILFFSMQAQGLLATTILVGLGIGVLLALWRNQLQMSLPAMIGLLLPASLSAIFYGMKMAWLGRLGLFGFLLLGAWFHRQQALSFPSRFIALSVAAFGAVVLVHQELYDESATAVAFIVLIALYLWLDVRENS
jgi:transcriptional regulator with XRE-family HTH domain